MGEQVRLNLVERLGLFMRLFVPSEGRPSPHAPLGREIETGARRAGRERDNSERRG